MNLITKSSCSRGFFLLLVCIFAATTTSALAQQPNGNLAEGGGALYPNFEDEFTFGGLIRGYGMITDEWFGLGGFTALSGDAELMALFGGAAYLHPLDSQTDLWGGPTLEYQKITFEQCAFNSQQQQNTCDNRSVDDLALGLRGGLRHQVHRDFEVEAGARIVTGSLDYIGLRGTGRYFWQGNLSFLAEVDFYDGNFGLIGGLSYAF